MATYTITNGRVSFAFVDDATHGFHFIAMLRIGQSHVWGNHDGRLWTATLFDSADPHGTPIVLDPDRAHLTGLNHTASVFEAIWSELPTLGGDRLNVTFRARLDADTDFLRCTLEANWSAGASRAAVDAIGPLPLAIPPFHPGEDAACMAMLGGVLSRDPVAHLRHAASPGTLFGTLARNEWFFPSGHGWSMPLWGYYETRTKQGWMLWLEEYSGAPVSILFESDGADLVWRASEPQPDHVVVANGGRPLGTTCTFCLRPLTIRSSHGWGDITQFYRDRFEAERPLGYAAQRAFREDLSAKERMHAVIVDVEAAGPTHVRGDGKPGDLSHFLKQLRQGAGLPSDLPIRGTISSSSYNLDAPAEAPNGDLASMLPSLPGQNVFLAPWFPGEIVPGLWDIRKWFTPDHVASERRWATTWDQIAILRESRSGFLDGDDHDTRLEGLSFYYRERRYSVVSWDAGTHTATVSGGDPSADGFTTPSRAILVRDTAIRLAQSKVVALGAGTIQLEGLPTDYVGVTRTPKAGDALVVLQETEDVPLVCPYAAVHGAAYLAALVENFIAAGERRQHLCGRYVDVWTSPNNRQPDDGLGARRLPLCYADHAEWAFKDPDFDPHPRGGGSWIPTACRALIAAFRDTGRESQQAAGRQLYYWMQCEFSDQTTQDLFDISFTPMATGRIWRNTDGVDPSEHRYLCVPMYAMVHAGRSLQRAINQEFSSALGDPSLDLPSLREFLAYCLADWPYGMTAPTFSFFQSDTIPIHDLFDDAIYRPAGPVHRDVKRIRDLWVQIVQAEIRQAGVYLHQGRMMNPAELVLELTDTTTGLAQSTFANDYHTYDVLYDRDSFPRVTHACWKGRDGSVMVVLVNWTLEDARWAGILDVEGFGFGQKGSTQLRTTTVQRTDAFGAAMADVSFDPLSARLSLATVPALSVALVKMRQPQPVP